MNADVAVVAFSGELDIARRDEVRSALHGAPAGRPVLVDLSDVTYADSTVISELLRFRREAGRSGLRTAVVSASAQLDRLLAYAGIAEAFPLFADRAAALRHLKEPA